jgi:hypothetical protein
MLLLDQSKKLLSLLDSGLKSGPSQILFIYLFILMTISDSEQMKDSVIYKHIQSPLGHFSIIFYVYYAMNGKLVPALLVSLIMCAILLGLKVIELFESKLRLIEPSTDVMLDTRDIKLHDILDHFDNDVDKLRQVLRQSNVPSLTELNDYNAPLVATYLNHLGYDIKHKTIPDLKEL